MKSWIKILIGIAIALVLLWTLSRLAGLVFWGLILLALGTLVMLGVRRWKKKRNVRGPTKGLLESEAQDDIDRLVKEMERLAGDS